MTESGGSGRSEPPAATRPVSLVSIFTSFVRVGSCMYGGGYAMLPLLEREVVERRRWCSHEAMSDIFALAQVIPGVIAVNSSMLVGQRLRGWRGAGVAALGTITAPFAVILLIAGWFETLVGLPWLGRLMLGLRPAVAGLLLGTAVRLVWRGWRKSWALAAGVAALAATLLLELKPVWLILGGIVAGLVWHAAFARNPGRAAP